jgi:hypothetical protein
VANEVNALRDWFERRLAPVVESRDPDAIGAWRRELSAISDLVTQPTRVRVALVGTTGAGKSTFLNAVLRQEVLPVGVMHPCTAFVTAVSYAAGPAFKLTIRYATPDEWRRDLDTFIAMLEPGEGDGDGESHHESGRMLEVARKRLQGVFGNAIGESSTSADVRAAKLPAEAREALDGTVPTEFTFHSAKEMVSRLKGLIRGESALWPLVREVSIAGPYESLAGGIELVDLPGLNDPNEARTEVTREYLRTSPFVWLVFSMVRGLTADIRQVLEDEKVLRTLVLSGTLSGLALVGTKADDVDMDSAEQLGLSDDCDFAELVSAYRERSAIEARQQLEEMIRDLPAVPGEEQTRQRMREMARTVAVHTTSARAYNKLAGVGRVIKDYGLEDERDTGIPEVRQHLRTIAQKAGADFNLRSASTRLQHLRQEIATFYRAKGEASSPGVGEARRRFREQSDKFDKDVAADRDSAVEQLAIRRQTFISRLDSLLEKSTQGVVRVTEGWHGIHWATMRAIVQRDGVFRSPSSGRSFDFNADVTEPLLADLPVSWERYFTDELGGVTRGLVIRVQEKGKHFCELVALTAELVSGRKGQGPMNDRLSWFRQKIDLLTSDAERHATTVVQQRRAELAGKIPLLARQDMQPAYDSAKQEQGAGMKSRILAHLDAKVRVIATPLYNTIQAVLLEGLTELESQIRGLYERLTQTALEQARIVVNNATIDLDSVVIDPKVAAVLKDMPQRTS